VTTWLADHRLTAREREQRSGERAELRILKQNDFQRQTLLDLQVASQRLLRMMGAIRHEDVMRSRSGGAYGGRSVTTQLSDGLFEANVDTMLLASRVQDQEVRTLSERLRDLAARVCVAASESDSDDAMQSAAIIQQRLIERTGELIREIDRP
jgi:hypothetical protein